MMIGRFDKDEPGASFPPTDTKVTSRLVTDHQLTLVSADLRSEALFH
jgi:hypothetical protein